MGISNYLGGLGSPCKKGGWHPNKAKNLKSLQKFYAKLASIRSQISGQTLNILSKILYRMKDNNFINTED